MANEIDVVTLAIAKKYARSVGSTITAITPTSTGLHFVTTTGSFDVNISDWTVYTPEEQAKLASLNAEILDKFTEDVSGNVLYNGEQIVLSDDLTGFIKDTSYVHTDNNYTTTEKNKLANIEDKAEVNQNTYNKVVVAGTEITADSKEDTITLIGGEGITLTPNADNKTVTIRNTGAGTVDYTALTNKPTINDVELTGNKTLTDLGISAVGTTGSYNDLSDTPNIPVNVSDLVNDSEFIIRTVDNLTNYYLSTQLYTKQEVEALISSLDHLTYLVVAELPTENISTSTMYLIQETGVNHYEQWMYISETWANLGSTEIDLSNYYTKANVDTLFVKQVEGKDLSTNDFTTAEKEKLASLENSDSYYTKAEVDSDFVQKEEGKALSTNDFTSELKNKLNTIEENANYYTLPMATVEALGGVMVDGITITIDENGIISSSSTNIINDAIKDTHTTWSSNQINSKLEQKVTNVEGKGLSTNDYTTEEKIKLTNIAENANNYTLPTASESILGGVKVDGVTITVDNDGIISSSGGGEGTVSSVNTIEPSTDGNVTITLDNVNDGASRILEKSWIGTKAEFDALGSYDSDTTYYTTDEVSTSIIDDTTIATDKTYSSNKISTEFAKSVTMTDDQTIAGTKTFTDSVIPNGASSLAIAQARKISAGTGSLEDNISLCEVGAIYGQYS